nr:putative protein TPRXL isoform X2 [Procambarus clarkii]
MGVQRASPSSLAPQRASPSSLASQRASPSSLAPQRASPASQRASPSSLASQRASPASLASQRASPPPSAAGSKGRRPTTLNVGAVSTPTKTSPTAKTPTSPVSGKSSPTRSPTPKKAGNGQKVTGPTTRTTTSPQGPVLATEARSKVRPCGCNRRHGGGAHHHPSSPPETPKDGGRGRPRSESPSKAQAGSPAGPHTPQAPQDGHKVPLNTQTALSTKTGTNRYVSRLVWVPRMTPERFSTTIVVSTQHPTFTDAIYIKNTPCGSSRVRLEGARHH